jgi:hypothetical protein
MSSGDSALAEADPEDAVTETVWPQAEEASIAMTIMPQD